MERKHVIAIVKVLPVPSVLLDQAGIILCSSQAARGLFGRDLQGEPLSLAIRAPSVLAAFEAAARDNEHATARGQSRSARDATIEFDFTPLLLLHDQGERLFLATCRDITREERIERMRSDFVANASHELRTPLTTLSGFIETMQGAARKDENARDEFLRLMKTQAERMSHLIDDLLSLSRIELDEHIEPRDVIDVGNIVLFTENLLRPMAEETGCEMTIDTEPNLQVRGDAGQLGQVLHNLVENAIKYAGKGKQVAVHAKRDGPMAVISIEDNGPGIAAHHIPRLTERFYRVNVQESRMRGGTGLGLAICKHIVNRHRGRLAIESQVGRGSRFSVYLPLENQ